jgi:hypothetical protein
MGSLRDLRGFSIDLPSIVPFTIFSKSISKFLFAWQFPFAILVMVVSFLVHAAGPESLHLLHELTDFAEYEGFCRDSVPPESSSKSPAPEPWLRNRLRQNVHFWRTFCTSTMILSILTVGYHLPWLNGPPQEPFCYDCAWLSLIALSTVTCNLWL